MRKALLVAALLAVACSAALGEGGSPGEFLNYAIAPRSLGMGKARWARPDSSSSMPRK